ncbi:TPA: hypothetical protein DDW69_04015 [candidate division CPR2 bacterium]|uniref:Uncharacterized protein n=1 Tax=candidate division CPR2 bacterium GW2011_GWC1_41_48 TaxID=1618344 RepID=A0A0G0Z7D2_UNCC2|nr:MAG: hypothetical protein UT47_C0003G0009 [candidate division CPR2 bacterium GW2011_GWC2_39_35]KKR27407.1 MAG: hypothetical protein UT60_C0050G0006 [candidate division CPR2 bacterium GW2011_GWD2_39_7]KKS08948.1 MAG: hypothetical protein UU65_C0003G0003 [candidate division CPR2 bacterium GW2011_GWC1_41_48]OGB71048.1 MAG: hypothetical protein A2Y26_01290 [candidate division CPR2 bacterium GWD2_39_7]HBG81975.1 hypothetical protein [candidate division CPR2 bacterium]
MKTKLLSIWKPIADFLTKYISIGYLCSSPRGNILMIIILSISGVLFLGGIIVKYLLPRKIWKLKERVYKKYLNYFFKWTWGFAFFGAFLSFFAYEETAYFGYRLWLYTWVLALFAWIIYTIFIFRPKLKADLKKHHKKKEKEKWMKK